MLSDCHLGHTFKQNRRKCSGNLSILCSQCLARECFHVLLIEVLYISYDLNYTIYFYFLYLGNFGTSDVMLQGVLLVSLRWIFKLHVCVFLVFVILTSWKLCKNDFQLTCIVLYVSIDAWFLFLYLVIFVFEYIVLHLKLIKITFLSTI